MIPHKHLLLRAEVAEPIVDPEVAKDWLRRLVATVGMVICKSGGPHVDYVEKPDNYGIAAVVMIETSHCSLHIWDKAEPPLVQFDLYSCAEFDAWSIVPFIEEMRPTRMVFKVFDRSETIQEIDSHSLDSTA